MENKSIVAWSLSEDEMPLEPKKYFIIGYRLFVYDVIFAFTLFFVSLKIMQNNLKRLAKQNVFSSPRRYSDR